MFNPLSLVFVAFSEALILGVDIRLGTYGSFSFSTRACLLMLLDFFFLLCNIKVKIVRSVYVLSYLLIILLFY